MNEPWTFYQTRELHDFIDNLGKVTKRQVNRDIQKLTTRGIGAKPPLVSHLEGDVWYLRSKAGNEWCRCFYYRSGKRSFCGFYGYKKKSNKIRKRVRDKVMRLHAELRVRGGSE